MTSCVDLPTVVPGGGAPAPAGTDLGSAALALGEAELASVADALHDGALQALVVARYAADLAVRGGDPVAARDAVQDALVALRQAVWSLRPRGTAGLPAALDHLASHLEQTGGAVLSVDVDAEAAVVAGGLSSAAARAAYRLVQRAAGDRPVTALLRRTDTGLRLALDVPVADAAGESLRARAVGATLLATRDCTALHLPLPGARLPDVPPPALPLPLPAPAASLHRPPTDPRDARAVPVVPAQRDGQPLLPTPVTSRLDEGTP